MGRQGHVCVLIMEAACAPRWREANTAIELPCVLQMVGLVYMVGALPWAGKACGGVAVGLCVCLWRRARRGGGGMSHLGVCWCLLVAVWRWRVCMVGLLLRLLGSTHTVPAKGCMHISALQCPIVSCEIQHDGLLQRCRS